MKQKNKRPSTKKKGAQKQSEAVPESPEAAKKFVFRKIWEWFRKKPVIVKIILVLVVFIILAVLCRLNLLGEKPYTIAKLVLPFYIPGIDTPLPVIPLHVQLTAEGNMGERVLKRGENIFSGEKATILFSSDISCWLTIFCIDSTGLHEVFQNSLEPSWIIGEKEFTISFEFDDTEGTEAYYFIASLKQFGFEKDIKPALRKIFPAGNTKGPAKNRYELMLKQGYTSIVYYFNHLPGM